MLWYQLLSVCIFYFPWHSFSFFSLYSSLTSVNIVWNSINGLPCLFETICVSIKFFFFHLKYQPFRFFTFSRVQLFFFIQTFLIHKTAVSYWYSDFSHLFQHSISVDTSFRPYSSLYGIQPLKSNIFFLFFLFSIKISVQLGFVLVSTCKQERLEALLL